MLAVQALAFGYPGDPEIQSEMIKEFYSPTPNVRVRRALLDGMIVQSGTGLEQGNDISDNVQNIIVEQPGSDDSHMKIASASFIKAHQPPGGLPVIVEKMQQENDSLVFEYMLKGFVSYGSEAGAYSDLLVRMLDQSKEDPRRTRAINQALAAIQENTEQR